MHRSGTSRAGSGSVFRMPISSSRRAAQGGTTNQQLQTYVQGGTAEKPGQLGPGRQWVSRRARRSRWATAWMSASRARSDGLSLPVQSGAGRQGLPDSSPTSSAAAIFPGRRRRTSTRASGSAFRVRWIASSCASSPRPERIASLPWSFPPKVRVDDLTQKNEGMQAIDDFDAFLASIVGREQSTRGVSVEEATPTKRAVAIREYDIVP